MNRVHAARQMETKSENEVNNKQTVVEHAQSFRVKVRARANRMNVYIRFFLDRNS